MPKPLSRSEKLDRFPPVAVRLLARRGPGRVPRALFESEICHTSGLTPEQVRRISRLASWKDVTNGETEAFLRGCGVDLDNRDWLRKNTAYMAKIKGIPRYLKASAEWSTHLQPLISVWASVESA